MATSGRKTSGSRPKAGVKLLGFPLGRDPAQSAVYRVGERSPFQPASGAGRFSAPELAFGRHAPDAGPISTPWAA